MSCFTFYLEVYLKKFLLRLRCRTQWMRGSPTYPGGQVQEGVWSLQLHTAPNPQTLFELHGLKQCWLIQALSPGQSELITHSGTQPDCGSPWNSGKQEQTGRPLTTWHWVFNPQGLGMHGFPEGISIPENILIYMWKRFYMYISKKFATSYFAKESI